MLFAEFFYALELTIFFSMLFFLFVPSDKQRFENLKKEIEKDRKKYENRLLRHKIKSEFGESVIDWAIMVDSHRKNKDAKIKQRH